MATEVSVSYFLHRQLHHRNRHLSAANHRHPSIQFPKRSRHYNNLSPSLSASHSPSSSSSPSSNPFPTGRFLTNDELENLEFLSKFSYHQELESGLLWVRVMREDEMEVTATLLSESFAESMMITADYLQLLEFYVKNHLIERREKMPHNATLLGIYREIGDDDFELAGTVDLTFDRNGINRNPPTPTPPKNSPYICNMAVAKPLRRKGIGWHLLKASEELITEMSSSEKVYLHCRTIDEGPLNMYAKAGYIIVKTDNILTWLKLQRRRHLMCKELPFSHNAYENDFSKEQPTESTDG
ncbi:hypothetical protein OROGR_001463 [Orobanche gracilis]